MTTSNVETITDLLDQMFGKESIASSTFINSFSSDILFSQNTVLELKIDDIQKNTKHMVLKINGKPVVSITPIQGDYYVMASESESVKFNNPVDTIYAVIQHINNSL